MCASAKHSYPGGVGRSAEETFQGKTGTGIKLGKGHVEDEPGLVIGKSSSTSVLHLRPNMPLGST